MFKSSVRGAAVVAVALSALCVSCGTSPSADKAAAGVAATSSTGAPGVPRESLSVPVAGSTSVTASAEKVRDAFAGLQATLSGSCTDGCTYFLGRVHHELQRLGLAMGAGPKGPDHFRKPIGLIDRLDAALGGDRSFYSLNKHQALLIGARDEINTWLQGHPEDYR
ncbi:hypothetical protein ABT095_25535 [Kitasatospora sp. NPDC002227]|uniref:hypothetical protein n=1 Tax=Kitasatospora sp. NPDC002227 TaxID=3154773 RepID=UPI0033303BCE